MGVWRCDSFFLRRHCLCGVGCRDTFICYLSERLFGLLRGGTLTRLERLLRGNDAVPMFSFHLQPSLDPRPPAPGARSTVVSRTRFFFLVILLLARFRNDEGIQGAFSGDEPSDEDDEDDEVNFHRKGHEEEFIVLGKYV